MIQVFTDKESTVSFRMNIDGNKSLPEARLLLQLPSITLSIPGTISEGVITAVVPPLKHLLKETIATSVQARLEVIADNMLFTPWKQSIDLRESISVTSDAAVLVEAQSPQVSIVVESAQQSEQKPAKKPVAPPTLSAQESKGYLEAIEELMQLVAVTPEADRYMAVKRKLREAVKLQNQADDDKNFTEYQRQKGRSLAILEALKEA